ncbi:hypothetical protein [Paenibacillus aquistagni]|uniref:Uncharacterized protein n=1 Tax=Paenibacillus aquistagni TaxID=1852522 RepID=A0A1X7KAF1_9BACL|nr:hypothetical protein [Paenibacillus aquistagni]SMG38146.1 hypothetical protein SAMN06295960_2279 [Paenibacillus aquistagni]
MNYTGKTNWQFDEVVKEADLNRIEQGLLDAHAGVETAKSEAKAYTDEKVAGVTPGAIGAVKKSDFDAHTADAGLHVTAAKQAAWDAKETPAGAQAKANQAEGNAKNASLPRSGGVITGPVESHAGGNNIALKGGSADHSYLSFFARTASPSTRSGYIGYPNAGIKDLHIKNEIAGGSVDITASKVVTVGGSAIVRNNKGINTTIIISTAAPSGGTDGDIWIQI